MKCNHCGNNELSRSHRSYSEKFFTAVIPVRPYRCSRCSKRNWRLLAWYTNKQKYYPLLAILVVVPLSILGSRALSDARQPTSTPYLPVQATSSADTEYLLRRSKPPAEAVKTVYQPALSAAPEVHLWVGFRVVRTPVRNSRNTINHSNGMRLSFPKGAGVSRSQKP